MDPTRIALPSTSGRSDSNEHGSRDSSRPSRSTRRKPTSPLLDSSELDKRTAAGRADRKSRTSKSSLHSIPLTYVLPGQPLTFDRISVARDSPAPYQQSERSHGRSRGRESNDPSKSRLTVLTTSLSSSSKADSDVSSSAEHADASRAWPSSSKGKPGFRGKFQAEPMSLSQSTVAYTTVRISGETTYQSQRKDQPSRDNHPSSPHKMAESEGNEGPQRLDDQHTGRQRIVGDPRKKNEGGSSSHHHQGQQICRAGVSSPLESLSLGSRVVDDSARSNQASSSGATSTFRFKTTSRLPREDRVITNVPLLSQIPGETKDDAPNVPTEQGCVQEPTSSGSDGGPPIQLRTSGIGSSEETKIIVSAIQHTLTLDFLSPFTDSLGSSLRKINQRLQSISSLYDFVKNDVTQIKKELGDEGSYLNSSLYKISTSVSLLQEKMSRSDEKHSTMMKNMKKDISSLSSDMYDREIKRDDERKHEKNELKDEIHKHSSIDSNVDFSAVFTRKLDCFRDEMKKEMDERLIKQQKQFFELFKGERIVSSASRQDVTKQLTTIIERINHPGNSSKIDEKLIHLEKKLEKMDIVGSEDRRAMLDGILHMQGQNPNMHWRPMQSTPIHSFPRYHQPPHLDPSRLSPLNRGSMNNIQEGETNQQVQTPHSAQAATTVQPAPKEGSVHSVQETSPENVQRESGVVPVLGVQEERYQQPMNQQKENNMSSHLYPSFRYQQNLGGYMKEELNQYGNNNTGEDLVQIALLKQLRRDYTSSKDWPRFNGEGEYNHNEFIDWVDQTVQEQGMPDKLVTAKLSLVLTGVARDWYVEKRKDTGSMTWPEWKEAIQSRFGTDEWRNQMEERFRAGDFNPIVHKDCIVWALKQKRRLRAFDPDIRPKESSRENYYSE